MTQVSEATEAPSAEVESQGRRRRFGGALGSMEIDFRVFGMVLALAVTGIEAATSKAQ